MDGFAFAAEVLVGQAVGKSNRFMLRDAVIKSGLWTFIIAVFLALIYALFGSVFIKLMTTSDEVILASEAFLIFIVLFCAPLAVFDLAHDISWPRRGLLLFSSVDSSQRLHRHGQSLS